MPLQSGFLYLLTHPSDPNLIKVGMTTRTPEVRLHEHNTQFDKPAGKVVVETGQNWVLKEFFVVEDTYNAENAFFQRSPLTELPNLLGTELIILDDKYMTWEWVEEGLKAAKAAGIRQDISQAPIPKAIPRKGAKWLEAQLEESGLSPLKGYGNGIMKVAFECTEGHQFKISGNSLVRFPYCPICEPKRFDDYTYRRIEMLN